MQLNVFDDEDDIAKRYNIMQAMDIINNSYGRMKIRSAVNGFERKWKLRQEHLSPCYTTRIDQLLKIKT